MLLQKAYKFRLEPSVAQGQKLLQFCGSARFVWNKALALQLESLKQTGKRQSYAELCRLLTAWKKEEETKWLQEAPIHALQQSLKHLGLAFERCFDPTLPSKAPTFKKRGRHDAFKESDPACFQVKANQIRLPKLGFIPFRQSRQIEGDLRNVTVSRQGKHWFVSIQTRQEVSEPAHPSQHHVGIDLGVKRFATLSDGKFYQPRDSFKKKQTQLAKAQRNLARKIKFSQNWKKQKQKISQIHTQIANVRKDFLHKLSTHLSKNHAMIVLEDLRIANMSRSAKGTLEQPGKQVKAKSGLNRSILEQGWGEFRRQLAYKQQWRGGTLKLVPAQNTSRRCFACGHTCKSNRKNQETFCCVSCGYSAQADLNASKNILAVGHIASACGEIELH